MYMRLWVFLTVPVFCNLCICESFKVLSLGLPIFIIYRVSYANHSIIKLIDNCIAPAWILLILDQRTVFPIITFDTRSLQAC